MESDVLLFRTFAIYRCLTSHSISSGEFGVVKARTPTGFDRGRQGAVEHIDSDIGLGSLAPTRL